MKIILLIMLLLGCLACGFCFGAAYEQEKNYSGVISPESAIFQLEHCQRAHQHYVDNPGECNAYTGDVERNQNWVEEYGEIIELLKRYK